MELGILEEVTEHTDWVNSYVIVEKDSGNHHAPNHTIKRKLRICLDPRDLNEALEREPYHTCLFDEITDPGATPISMAHIGNRFLLLEKNGLSDSCRCLFQIHPSEEIAQFYLCSCVHRIVYDCHRVGFASYNQE